MLIKQTGKKRKLAKTGFHRRLCAWFFSCVVWVHFVQYFIISVCISVYKLFTTKPKPFYCYLLSLLLLLLLGVFAQTKKRERTTLFFSHRLLGSSIYKQYYYTTCVFIYLSHTHTHINKISELNKFQIVKNNFFPSSSLVSVIIKCFTSADHSGEHQKHSTIL